MLLLLLLAACESGATFEVDNQCAYPAWVSVDRGPLLTLAPGETRSFSIDTGNENVFTGSVYESFPVMVYGETFTLERLVNGLPIPTDSTTVKIRAGENRKAPLLPNRASIKVTNTSNLRIDQAEIWKYQGPTYTKIGTLENLEPGESQYRRVEYASPTNSFYYVVRLYLAGEEEPLYYGDEDNILGKDEQYHLIFAGPENKKMNQERP